MKYGVQMLLFSDGFGESSVGLIRKAKELGFDGIEILIGDPGNFPSKPVREALAKYRMGINFAACLGTETNTISSDESVRMRGNAFLKSCIDTAYEVTGGGCTIGGPNYAGWCCLTGKSATKEEWNWAVSNYQDACEYASKKGITLTVEVVNRYETNLFNTAADACRFCSDVGLENAKVQLDTFHMSIEEKSWVTPVLKTGTKLGYLHVIENDRGIIGTGLVGWKELFGALKQISYNGWMTIEGFTRDFEGLAGATKVWRDPASSADDMAAKSLKALKGFECG